MQHIVHPTVKNDRGEYRETGGVLSSLSKCCVLLSDDVIGMDIETCSVKYDRGRFMVYSVGYFHEGVGDRQIEVNTKEDLSNSAPVWEALNHWNRIAIRREAAKRLEDGETVESRSINSGDEVRPIFVFAHNNSKFGGIAVIHSVLAHSQAEPIRDILVSNGRAISYLWKNLTFRDSMLIATGTLQATCKAYEIQIQKSYLPHGYLQNCDPLAQILWRLKNPVPWGELEPYMDWFNDVKPEDLQARVTNRTFEQWREE